jgi:hypothetical protein
MPLTRTVSQVMEVANGHEPTDPSRGLQLFNEAHQYICGQVRIYPDQVGSITMVAGQQEYPASTFTPPIGKIWDAFFYSSPGNWTPVYPRNKDWAYQEMGPSWRLQSAGQPYAIYESGGNLGLIPTPSVSTVAGYPNVTFYYSEIPVLGPNDSLPLVDTIYPWVYYMCSLAVLEDEDKDAEKLMASQKVYDDKFQFYMHRLRQSVYGRIGYDHPRVSGIIPRVRRA